MLLPACLPATACYCVQETNVTSQLLYFAATGCLTDCVRLLECGGVDVNKAGLAEYTALHMAVANQQADIASMLISKVPNPPPPL